jgi:hypothetical protein
MKLLKILMVALLLVFGVFVSNGGSTLQKDCNAIDVKVEVKETANGQNNGQVTITLIKGDRRTVKYIFCQSDGKVLNEGKFGVNIMEGLKKGEYICIVNTSECSKKISFTIA